LDYLSQKNKIYENKFNDKSYNEYKHLLKELEHLKMENKELKNIKALSEEDNSLKGFYRKNSSKTPRNSGVSSSISCFSGLAMKKEKDITIDFSNKKF
jgi:hypothetical protein